LFIQRQRRKYSFIGIFSVKAREISDFVLKCDVSFFTKTLFLLCGPDSASIVRLTFFICEQRHVLSGTVSHRIFLAAAVFISSYTSTVTANDPSDYRISVSRGGSAFIDLMENNNSSQYNSDSVSIYANPNNGYITRLNSSQFEYYHYAGTDNTDFFSYIIADYQGQYTDPISVYVDVDTGFSTGTDNIQVARGGRTTINLLDDMPSYNPASLHIVESPNRGYLTQLDNSMVQYTHYGDSSTTDQFSFSVADNSGSYSSPVLVSLTIGSGIADNGYSPAPAAAPTYSEPTQSVSSTEASNTGNQTNQSWWTPRASDNLTWQIQLQGDINVIDGVDVYAVDYTASQSSIDAAKANGAKVMCYISAGSAEDWRPDYADFPDYVIGNAYQGWPGEYWLDIRNIDALAPIMRARIDACAAKGFDAIDADNVNVFSNDSGFYVTRQDSIDYIRWLANESHIRGMAFSLKNSESLVSELVDDVDMMQSESCFVWGNCENASQMSAANKPVFAVEYEDAINSATFRDACNVAANLNLQMIYRDRALTPYGTFETCY